MAISGSRRRGFVVSDDAQRGRHGLPREQFSLEGYPSSITVGPDGRLWFADADVEGGRIGQVTVSGQVTSNYIQAPDISDPTTITPGPDGNMWFTVFGLNGDGKIGRVTPSGAVTLFPVPGAKWYLGYHVGLRRQPLVHRDEAKQDRPYHPFRRHHRIQRLRESARNRSGNDGNLWFTESGGNKIGRITTRGEYSNSPFQHPTHSPGGSLRDPMGTSGSPSAVRVRSAK